MLNEGGSDLKMYKP